MTADEHAHRLAELGWIMREALEQARFTIRNERTYKRVCHQRVAADVPAGLQADPRMRVADREDGLGIGLVELGRRDRVPMLFLTVLGRLD